ncbi:non-specific lipid-transfer protein 2-like [Phalaenopsis equestris]|uniref:non-specific lipid-transfer protein 2-like n=1 Tax=Phalaenopsis equestris TaxID=78828 RepID=UPI0009E38240|nr:non-specific lipid-transfer protein 2-like [Phalaenopsis equestris]
MRANLILLCFVSALLLSYAPTGMSQTCNPTQLSSCLGPITNGSPPDDSCCSSLKGQQPCLCQYLSNPALSAYINSANARKVAKYCKVPIPSC